MNVSVNPADSKDENIPPKITENVAVEINNIKNISFIIPQKTKEEYFIEALEIAKADGFNAICPFVHCYHETGNFLHLVGEWNYAGCKIPQSTIPPVEIKSVEVITHEEINGKLELLADRFADFRNADDFMKFYIWQIKRLYSESYTNRNSPIAYFYWLARGKFKWATDRSYSDKLENLYKFLVVDGTLRKYNMI